MANADAPFGFRVWKHASGGTPSRTNEYTIVAAYNAAIYQGDLVTQAADGTIAVASEGGVIIGIFKGVRYTATDGSVVFKNNWVASTATKSGTLIYAIVQDDPNAIYLTQATGTIAWSAIGQLADMDNAATGSATTGISAQAIVTGGSEDTFRIVDVLDVQHGYPVRNAAGNQDIAVPGANAYVLVKPIKHQLGGSQGTEI
jgi:hypothetical protein